MDGGFFFQNQRQYPFYCQILQPYQSNENNSVVRNMSLVLKQPGNLASSALRFFSYGKSKVASAATTGALTDKIPIFLTLDQATIGDYFNPNDPAPLYKRQLSHEFQQYIMASIEASKRQSVYNYKITCRSKGDRQFVESFVFAIRRHFSAKKLLTIERFEKFKRRTYILLFASLVIMMFCHVVVPLILSDEQGFSSAVHNGLDIFSWVILWQPIEKLIFHWNPHLKDISRVDRLVNAEVIITENE